jgi:hypothetical protein
VTVKKSLTKMEYWQGANRNRILGDGSTIGNVELETRTASPFPSLLARRCTLVWSGASYQILPASCFPSLVGSRGTRRCSFMSTSKT